MAIDRYEDLVGYLTTIATDKWNVAHVEFGQLENINFGEIRYPMVFFVLESTEWFPQQINYNIIMLVGTTPNKNLLQQNKVQSEMWEITRGILTNITFINPQIIWEFDAEKGATSTPFFDNYPDIITGFQTSFTIKVINEQSPDDC